MRVTRAFYGLFALGILAPAAFAATTFRHPVNYVNVSCTYATKNCAVAGWYHTAVDYGKSGTDGKVYASADGEVSKIVVNGAGCPSSCATSCSCSGCNDHGMGNTVIVKHNLSGGGTVYSLYAHMGSFASGLAVGQCVTRGQVLGTIGGSGQGCATYWTPHLHFEIKSKNVIENPCCGGPYWGYTPNHPDNYGYYNPGNFIGVQSSLSCGSGECGAAAWEFNNSLDGWTTNAHLTAYTTETYVGLNPLDNPPNNDPQFRSPTGLCVNAAQYPYLEMRVLANGPGTTWEAFFQRSTDSGFASERRVQFTVANDGAWHYVKVYLAGNANYNGEIARIRIDPPSGSSDGSWDHKGIDYIRFTNCNAPSWQWNTDGNKEGWTVSDCTIPGTQPSGGYFLLYPGTSDPQFRGPFVCESAADVTGVRIRMAAQTESNVVDVFFTTDAEPFFSSDKRIRIYITNNGSYYVYEVYFGDHPKWTGTIKRLRIDPPNGPNIVGFDYVELTDLPPPPPPPDTDPPTWDTTVGVQSVETPANCDAALRLTWNPASDVTPPVTYNVYRSTASGFAPDVATYVDSTQNTSYDDLGLVAGQVYYYVVRAQDAASPPNEDANVVEASATATDNGALAPVEGLIVSVAGDMAWTDCGALEVKYRVYRSGSPDFNSAVLLGETADGNTTNWNDPEVPQAGEAYFYNIRAVDECGGEL